MEQMMSSLQEDGVGMGLNQDNDGTGFGEMGGEEDDENQQMVFVDEDGRELDHETVMMMMNQEGLVQGPDGQFYYQGMEPGEYDMEADEDQEQEED